MTRGPTGSVIGGCHDPSHDISKFKLYGTSPAASESACHAPGPSGPLRYWPSGCGRAVNRVKINHGMPIQVGPVRRNAVARTPRRRSLRAGPGRRAAAA
jgi:hypothetical protein